MRGYKFAAAAGCPTAELSCLQSLTVDEIVNAQNNVSTYLVPGHSQALAWAPYVDGVELTDQVPNLYAVGAFSKVPTIIGDVGDEARIFDYGEFVKPMSQDEWIALLAFVAGKDSESVRSSLDFACR